MGTSMMIVVGIIIIIIVLNIFIVFSRAKNSVKRKGGRNYKPPSEAKQAEWRDKEIARRIEREQDDAFDRVMLRNETLSYYELVRKKYEKKEALERLGIKVDDEKLDEIESIGEVAVSEDYQLRDVRDDIYLGEASESSESSESSEKSAESSEPTDSFESQ